MFFQEFYRALRRLRQRPFISAAAAGAIALGVGITTPLVSYLDLTLFRPSLRRKRAERAAPAPDGKASRSAEIPVG